MIEPISDEARAAVDADALDKLNVLFSSKRWPSASGLEDVCAIVRATGRTEVPDAPAWDRH